MVRLGLCSMIVEPHVFEVTLYTVKETQFTFLPPAGQPQLSVPLHTTPSQESPAVTPGSISQPPASKIIQKPYQVTPQRTGSSSQPSLPPFHEGFAQFEPQELPLKISGHSASSTRIPPPHVPAQSPSLPGTPNATTQDSTTNSDPVIQMLAARAATDHDLKSLMKVVALGNASPDQLKIFQSHIDELHAIIDAQKNVSTVEGGSIGQTSDADPRSFVPAQNIPAGQTLPTHPTPTQTLNTSALAGIKTEPLSQYYSQPPQYLKAKGPVPPRQEICAIALEFTAGTGDRYLLPKYSILEYLPGNTQVLMSFLITRKGNAAASGKYKDNLEYYQPVTIRFSTQNPQILERLSRVVAPAEEVKRHMSDIMNKMDLAEEVYLVTQLPRTHEGNTMEQEIASSNLESEVRITRYPPPDSLLPLFSAGRHP